jgi:hypothetical protein
MNMNMPGFTADAALSRRDAAYRLTAQFARPGGTVLPAALPTFHCNVSCLDNCEDNCLDPSDCWDLPPQARAACIRAAAQCRSRCIHRCCH